VVYIQWGEHFVKDPKKDSGEASYKLGGTVTAHYFEVQARNSDNFNLQVELQSIATTGNSEGSIIRLGWKRDGFVYFILSGTEGQFASTNPPVAWMQSNLSTLGPRPLQHLCIPGSHNSGMCPPSSASFPVDRWVITQKYPISRQLELGVRYLDCRPVISAGCFVAGYYADVPTLGWQGLFILSQWTHK